MVSYDNRVLLFGGRDPDYPYTRRYGDTWEWDGNGWQERKVPGPSPRAGHTMAVPLQ